MPSPFRLFMHRAFLDFMSSAPYALSASAKYLWSASPQGVRANRRSRPGEAAEILVFGVVQESVRVAVPDYGDPGLSNAQVLGKITLRHPAWSTDGVLGRQLGIKYDEQLLNLCRFIQEEGSGETLDGEYLILATVSDYIAPPGAAIIASATLELIDGGDMPYVLHVLAVEAVFADRAS
ncbi:hypothetical protein B0H15DRAFT_952763 [Mycena belliarum]|uniref:Uncharacterized protein n=1 Tax=Mycena belliarum TaxID=1033014 RepID=A0AAD6U0Q8_9AGAR|nr:hypothetical protein B0H15DRAFT_952763 [Mycena belliae]